MEAVRTAAAAGQGGSGGKSRHSRYWPSKVALHDTLDPTSYSCNDQCGRGVSVARLHASIAAGEL